MQEPGPKRRRPSSRISHLGARGAAPVTPLLLLIVFALAVASPTRAAGPRVVEFPAGGDATAVEGLVQDDGGAWYLAEGRAQGRALLVVGGLPPGGGTLSLHAEVVGPVELELRGPAGGWTPVLPGEAVSHRGVRAVYRVTMSADPDEPPSLRDATARLRWVAAPPTRAPGEFAAAVRAPAPEVVSRDAWGAHPPFDPYDPHEVEAVVIHHSYIPDHASYLRRGGAESVAGIQRFHQFDPTRGWNDVGYHYLIGPDGLVFAGRPPGVIGAHAVPNTGKVGICMIGYHDPGFDEVTPAAWAALEDLVTSLAHEYDISVVEALHGHREFSTKTCPGELVYERFGALRAEVHARIGTMGEE